MDLQFENIDDDSKWDELVKELPTYSFLNSSARYRYNQEVGSKSFRFAIFEKDRYIGIIMASVGRSKLFGNFLECKHSPYLVRNTQKYWEEIFFFCKSIAKENSCFLLRFAPLYVENNELLKFYNANSFKEAPIHNVDALISQQLNLEEDIESIRRGMNKTKRNLLNRLIGNEDIKVGVFNDTSQFQIFKEFHEQTVKLKGYTDKPVNLLLKELEQQVEKGMCYMLVGYYKEKAIGVWQCTVYGKHMHLYQAATDTEFRDKNINISYILFWEAIKLGKQLNCEIFDLFGGVVPEAFEEKKHPWRGVNDFKRSLGGQKVTYMHSRDYALNKLLYPIYYIYSWFRTSIKGHTIKW